MEKFSCIIPFYNEGESLLKILNIFSSIPEISQIIIIDDGSTFFLDKLSSTIKSNSKIELIRIDHNVGKSLAVLEGLKKVRNDYTIMFDADYQNVIRDEVRRVIHIYDKVKNEIDMLLLQVKGGNNFLDKLMCKEVLFTGYRILKTIDLKRVFNRKFTGYQLEVAINQYMLDLHKRVFFLPTTVSNIHKSKKWGLLIGFRKSISMELSILYYLGFIKLFYQMINLCKNELKLFKDLEN